MVVPPSLGGITACFFRPLLPRLLGDGMVNSLPFHSVQQALLFRITLLFISFEELALMVTLGVCGTMMSP